MTNKFADQEIKVKPLTAADLAVCAEIDAASDRLLQAGKARQLTPEAAERYARKMQSAVG